jgi:AGCS family alanine or glycine:cation symporter
LTLNTFRLCVIGMVFLGSVASLSSVWNLADLFMALMAIVNLVAITLLGKRAYIALEDYVAQRKRGIAEPEFDPKILPNTHGIACWPRAKDDELN